MRHLSTSMTIYILTKESQLTAARILYQILGRMDGQDKEKAPMHSSEKQEEQVSQRTGTRNSLCALRKPYSVAAPHKEPAPLVCYMSI